jgi:hypothetical protein
VKIHVGEVEPEQGLASCEEEAEASRLCDFVDQGNQPTGREFSGAHILGIGGFVDVTVDAVQVAAAGSLDGPVDRNAALVGLKPLQ